MEKKDLESMLAEALAGRSGSLVEEIDGKSATVYYAPLNAYPHTWAAVIVVP